MHIIDIYTYMYISIKFYLFVKRLPTYTVLVQKNSKTIDYSNVRARNINNIYFFRRVRSRENVYSKPK